MKLVYSLGSIGNSAGIERVLSVKANYFTDTLGYEVHIVVAGREPQSLFYRFSSRIYFHYLNLDLSPKNPCNCFRASRENKAYRRRLEQTLVAIQPDITISVFGRDAAFLFRLNDGSRKVLEFHFTKNYLRHLGTALEHDKWKYIRQIWLSFLSKQEECMAKKYDHIVLLTEWDRQLWGGGERFAVIPNPLSFEMEEAVALRSRKIISMGRLVYPKGFQCLIRAFALIHEQFPEWTVDIYGEGQDKARLQEEINRLLLQDKVFLNPPEEDVKSLLMDASLFVLPSLYEGFGLVLTEAMECGVPCIAFDCECGPRGIISDNEDGCLVELRNIEALARKMSLLMKDDDLRINMGVQAKENVKRYSIDKIGNQWQAYFRSILKLET